MSLARRFAVLALLLVHVGCLPIDRWSVQTTPQPGNKEFDLRAGGTDANGFPLNPAWASQASDPSGPPVSDVCGGPPEEVFRSAGTCTSQNVRHDMATLPTLAVCGIASSFPGHVNWTPATVTGTVTWLTWAAPWDNDVNFYFVPDDGSSGLTKGNESIENSNTPYIELEFTSDETLAYFSTPWWTEFWNRVQRWSDSQETDADIRAWLNPGHPDQEQRAVVFGLFGLDCEHGCKSEVHPVFGLALETHRSATSNTWAIFVRNWGTEGFCASRLHYVDLPNQAVRLSLPGPGTSAQQLSTATILEYATLYPTETPDPVVESNSADGRAVVTLPLPKPDAHPLSELVLKLSWEPAAVERVFAPSRRPTLPTNARVQTAQPRAEDRLRALVRTSKQPAGTARVAAGGQEALPPLGPRKTTLKKVPPPSPVGIVKGARVPQAPLRVPAARNIDSKKWFERRRQSQTAMLRALCEQHQRQLPTFTPEESQRICAAVMK
jgi:hypothetical protein